jgi:hypothetical protein
MKKKAFKKYEKGFTQDSFIILSPILKKKCSLNGDHP